MNPRPVRTTPPRPRRAEGAPAHRPTPAGRRCRTTPRRSATLLRPGLSLVEMLIALAISAVLLTAVMVALNASFHAYATASESASAQSSIRLVMHRLLTMIRTTTDHAAWEPGAVAPWLPNPAEPPERTTGIIMLDKQDREIRIWWTLNTSYSEDNLGDLWYWRSDFDANGNGAPDDDERQPLLERVTARTDADGNPYIFALSSRLSDRGLLLRRATVDLTIEPGTDATLALESARGSASPIRLIASAMPRRNLD